MPTAKETYKHMVEKLRPARTYSEFKATEREFLSQEYLNFNIEHKVYEDVKSETDKEFEPSFRLSHDTLPADETIERAEETIDGTKATLHLPDSTRARIYFVLENGAWKYDLANITESLGNTAENPGSNAIH